MDDGSAYVVEEVRTGKKDLTFNTMWKYPRGLPATQAIQLAMRANVRNDTRDIDVSIVENPKPRNSLYTVEAVDTNEKSSAVSWVTTEIEKEFQGLERPPHTEDGNILAKIVDDFNSNKRG
ncbi:hypothetical protein [Taylorella asinigenitalis]|uniref:Uncharacterized protein n=1 Tax=Taylorella asinigenitalis (strain MCE3) TaxID=1008459 RepID=G4QCX0_TAYAM|nr:hypothetical protein [Taylorella asinigenitalis]AEP36250.1 hypothetical protein TASI_0475 [Taylorella asinigenitalis MCE3]